MPLYPINGKPWQTRPSSGPAGPPSVFALRAACGGCASTRACGRSPKGEGFEVKKSPAYPNRYAGDFLHSTVLVLHKITDQRLQQVVAVNAADDGAGVLVGRDVGRVLRQDVADELIDGVVALRKSSAACLISISRSSRMEKTAVGSEIGISILPFIMILLALLYSTCAKFAR